VVFLGIWGDLLLVLVMTRTRELWSVVALLSSQKSNLSIQWNNLAVLAVLSSLPLVIVWIFGQKYVISGMTAGIKK
jgi:raffinose/stachyose/melibiose transport system permease protein